MTAPLSDVRRRRIAIVAAPAVLAVMYPIFRLSGLVFGSRVDGYLAWAVGLSAYWLLWGTAFPLWAGMADDTKAIAPQPG